MNFPKAIDYDKISLEKTERYSVRKNLSMSRMMIRGILTIKEIPKCKVKENFKILIP